MPTEDGEAIGKTGEPPEGYTDNTSVRDLIANAIDTRYKKLSKGTHKGRDRKLGPGQNPQGEDTWVWVAILEYACCDNPQAWIESYITMNPGRHNPDDHDNSDFKPDAPFGYPERKQPPLDGELEDAIDDALNADEKMKDEGEGPGFSGEASVPGTESSAESSSSSNSDDEPNVRRNSGGKGERKRMIEGFTKITVRGERNIPPASRGDGESFPIGLGQTPLPPPPGFPAPGGKSCMIAIADAPTRKKATHSAFTVIGRVVWSPLGECGELPMDTCESAVPFTLNYEKKADHLREKWKKGFYQMRRLSPEQVDHFLGK